MTNPTTLLDNCGTYTAGGGYGANLPTGATGYYFQNPANWQIVSSVPTGETGQAFQFKANGTNGSVESWVWSNQIDGNNGNCDYTLDFYMDTAGGTASEFLAFFHKPYAPANPPAAAYKTNLAAHYQNLVINNSSLDLEITATSSCGATNHANSLSSVYTGGFQGVWMNWLQRVQGNHVSLFLKALSGTNSGKWLNASGTWVSTQTAILTYQDNYLAGQNGGIGFGMYSSGSTVYIRNIGWSPSPALFRFPTTTGTADTASAPLIVPSAVTETTVTLNATAPVGNVGTVSYQWQQLTTANGSATNVGANSLTLAQTGLTTNTGYFYQLVATDGTTGLSCTSPQVWVNTLNASRALGTFYCDCAAGSDGSGTQGSPYNSFTGNMAATLAALVPGDTINLVGGSGHANYTGPLLIANQMGLPGSPITVQSTNSSGVPLTSNLATIANSGGAASGNTNHNASAIVLTDCQYVTVNYVQMQGPGLDSTNDTISITNTVSNGGSAGAGALAGHGVLLDSAVSIINPTLVSGATAGLGAWVGADWFGHKLQGNTISNCAIDGFYNGIMLFAGGSHGNVGAGTLVYLINFYGGQDYPTISGNQITNCANLGIGSLAEEFHIASGKYVDPSTDAPSEYKAQRINGQTQTNTNIARQYLHRQLTISNNIVVNVPGDKNTGTGFDNTYTGCGIVISNTEGAALSGNAISKTGLWCVGSGGPLAYFCMNSSYVSAYGFATHLNTTGGGDGGGYDIDERSIQCRLSRCVSYSETSPGIGIELVDYEMPSVGSMVDHNAVYSDPKNAYSNQGIRATWLNNTFYVPSTTSVVTTFNTWPQLVANNGFVYGGTGTLSITLDANATFVNNGLYPESTGTVVTSGGTATGNVTGNPLLVNLATAPAYASSAPYTTAATVQAWTGVDPMVTTSAWANTGVNYSALLYAPAVAPTFDMHGVSIPVGVFDIGAVNASSGVATAFTLSGPSSGVLNAASANFTFTPNGTYTGTATPTDSSGEGSFSPSSLTYAGGSSAETFTYTPSTPGARNINAVATGLTASVSIVYTSLVVSATAALTTETYALTGSDTSWSGAPFTLVSGPSGCTLSAQTVTDTTHAVLTFASTTGAIASAITISDGTNTFAIRPPAGSGGDFVGSLLS